MPDVITTDLPKTDWVALADQVGREIAATTARHDEEETFVEEGFRALKDAGFFKALIPAELGGLGADYRDVCNAIRRLGTYCGSTALAFSMHSHLVAVPAWRWRHEKAPVEGMLKRVASENLILISSGGSDWLPSNGRAVKAEGGFRVSAKKVFSSGCQMGDLLVTSAIHDDPEKGPTVLHFAVPFKAEGVRRLDTWRVLGMRGTGSHDVVLEDVFVPDAAIVARREPGKWHILFHHIFALAFPLVYSAYVGVAEGARTRALEIARDKPKTHALTIAAGRLENAFMQAEMSLDRMITIAETETSGPERTSRAAIAHTLTAQAAIATVERAMELVGGASFYRDLGLERAFRDVQGARFHPLQEVPQLELTGRMALGMGVDG
ncbi:acyl-CoA dehydrogenase family protein [Neoroseomonas oryzicola]|uniref:Acyl-CoA dehydrogenase n=1 Tax=Neoroseomonas oryzicola TaxID=535904 RepID=A0A9X9WGQ2_9PROT|nr:acyl-CoA dehydrogenase family protein [Neoroseomonas oryzicola]MBR0659512.1 acyl-CoA dehydrogenase [Neoroseomonas oryzicola]NKE16209.1 acyl-CoA dehydrogenase [Neoroseomonas oryzicola]